MNKQRGSKLQPTLLRGFNVLSNQEPKPGFKQLRSPPFHFRFMWLRSTQPHLQQNTHFPSHKKIIQIILLSRTNKTLTFTPRAPIFIFIHTHFPLFRFKKKNGKNLLRNLVTITRTNLTAFSSSSFSSLSQLKTTAFLE